MVKDKIERSAVPQSKERAGFNDMCKKLEETNILAQVMIDAYKAWHSGFVGRTDPILENAVKICAAERSKAEALGPHEPERARRNGVSTAEIANVKEKLIESMRGLAATILATPELRAKMRKKTVTWNKILAITGLPSSL